MSSRDSIDAQAEREAAAIDWMAENVEGRVSGVNVHTYAAAVLSKRFSAKEKATLKLRYPRGHAIRAHLRLCDAIKANDWATVERIIAKARQMSETADERKARLEWRLHKLHLALTLASSTDKTPVSLTEASALTGISETALGRAAREKRLPAQLLRKRFTRYWSVTKHDLAAYAIERATPAA